MRRHTTLAIKDQDFPFLHTYFKSVRATTESFSFSFLNADRKLKISFELSSNLLNIETGTEEVTSLVTKHDFYTQQKPITEFVIEYNNLPGKYFVN